MGKARINAEEKGRKVLEERIRKDIKKIQADVKHFNHEDNSVTALIHFCGDELDIVTDCIFKFAEKFYSAVHEAIKDVLNSNFHYISWGENEKSKSNFVKVTARFGINDKKEEYCGRLVDIFCEILEKYNLVTQSS